MVHVVRGGLLFLATSTSFDFFESIDLEFPVPAHHAGTVPTPIDYGVGEYLFQTVDRGF